MRQDQGRMLATVDQVERFIDGEAAALDGAIAPAVRARLGELKVKLAVAATEQNENARVSQGATALLERYRAALYRDHMVPIAKVATMELAHSPELVSFKLPRKRPTDQQLVSLATGMAEAARPHEQLFIAAGRKPGFIERLAEAAQKIVATEGDAKERRGKTVKASENVRDLLRQVTKMIAVLDAYVKEAVGSDAGLLARWKTARRVPKKAGVRAGASARADAAEEALAEQHTAVAA